MALENMETSGENAFPKLNMQITLKHLHLFANEIRRYLLHTVLVILNI